MFREPLIQVVAIDFLDGAHETIVIRSYGFQGSHSALLGAQGIYSCMVGLSFIPLFILQTLLSHLWLGDKKRL